MDLGSDSDCNVDDVADEKPISKIPKSVTKKGEDLKIHINEFYLDLPKGEEFVKNSLYTEFWDSVNN